MKVENREFSDRQGLVKKGRSSGNHESREKKRDLINVFLLQNENFTRKNQSLWQGEGELTATFRRQNSSGKGVGGAEDKDPLKRRGPMKYFRTKWWNVKFGLRKLTLRGP